MNTLAEVFKAVSDPTRLRLLRLLLEAGVEVCGCELVDSLLVPQYNLSKHLRVLRGEGLITSRKEGQWVYYRIATTDPARASLVRLIAQVPDRSAANDLKRFKRRLKLRTKGRCLVGVQNIDLVPNAGTGRSRGPVGKA